MARNTARSAAAEAADRQRGIAAERMQLGVLILGDRVRPTFVSASQFWLHLPEHWDSRSFANESLSQGAAVTPGDTFRVDPEAADPRAVRVCLCAEADGGRIEEGLKIVAALIASHPVASTPIV